MTIIAMGDQSPLVQNAVQRILKDHHYGETPDLAKNAIELIVRLYDSGISDEDDLVELAALSGGKPLDESFGTATPLP